MRIPFFLLSAGAAFAAPSPLDRPVAPLRFEHATLPAALRVLARATHVSIGAEPDLPGQVTADLPAGTLRGALFQLTAPLGYYFEDQVGAVMVRRLKTVLYPIDYP